MSDHTVQFVAPATSSPRARRARRSRAAQELSRRDGLPARQARDAVPDDTELQQLRDLGEAVRQHALAQLPALLERLETKLTEAGVHVHWAETAAEANAIVLGIAQAKKARRVIKGKSMASEEIELNHALAEHGVDCIESDMGEFIVQLAGEKPSHIVMPAIHKTRGDIAELFQEHIPGTRYTEDVDELIQTGRRALRRAFAEADIGLSGVNFAAADTGTLWLVENEGNGRLSTTVPDTHVAIMGIEKVVEKLEHIVPLSSLLTRSATGQAITTYFNLIQPAPRRRTRRPARAASRAARQRPHAGLRGRAAARDAAVHPLRRVHEPLPRLYAHRRPRLRHDLPGLIGKIISPHLLGLDATADLPTASTLWRLRRGMPGADSDPAAARAAAHRSEPQA